MCRFLRRAFASDMRANFARVTEAPMQEIAEFWSQMVRRTLWGFELSAGDGALAVSDPLLSWG